MLGTGDSDFEPEAVDSTGTFAGSSGGIAAGSTSVERIPDDAIDIGSVRSELKARPASVRSVEPEAAAATK